MPALNEPIISKYEFSSYQSKRIKVESINKYYDKYCE